jgi:multidrug efflux pump subunit AcrB
VWLELRGSLPLTELSAFARETLVDELQRLPGVGGVELRGIAERRIIVHPDLDKLVALKLTLFEVLAVLQSTEVGSVEALGDVVIKQVDGAAVKLVDIARVEEGFEREPGDPALAIRAQSGAQKSKVLAAVRERLAKLERPAGVEVVEAPSPTPAPRAASLVVTISGPSLDELDKIADSYVAQLRGFEVVRDPPEGEWEQTVLPDRDRAATLGVPMTDIFATLRAVGTARVGRLGETDIVMKVMSPSLPLDKLFVRTRDGTLIPLAMVVSVKDGRSATILRINRERAIVLSIYGSADKARKVISEGALPPGYRIKLGP